LKGIDIMLQTFEAEMQPNGVLRFAGFNQPKYDAIQKVLVTVLPSVTKPVRKTVKAKTSKKDDAIGSWGGLIGALEGSPNFNGDPIAMQRKMRSEWN
jgi:hypothetical protein